MAGAGLCADGRGGIPVFRERHARVHRYGITVLLVGISVGESQLGDGAWAADPAAGSLALAAQFAQPGVGRGELGEGRPGVAGGGGDGGGAGAACAGVCGAADAGVDWGAAGVHLGRDAVHGRTEVGPGGAVSARVHGVCDSVQCARLGGILAAAVGHPGERGAARSSWLRTAATNTTSRRRVRACVR